MLIALAREAQLAAEVKHENVMGTPLYMAPETIDARAERHLRSIFSASASSRFELLVGRAPFTESPALAQLQGSSVAPAPALSSLVGAIPSSVAAILDRCLAFDSEDRPSAAEVFRAIESARVRT